MINQIIRPKLDYIGISLSLLCALHCSLLPLLITSLPLWGLSFLANKYCEAGIITASFLIGVYSLICGYKRTKLTMPLALLAAGFTFILSAQFLADESYELKLMVAGGLLIAAAHFKNWKAMHKSSAKAPCCTKSQCPNA
jgi:hypothetical protein